MATVRELADALRNVSGVESWLANGAAEAVEASKTSEEAYEIVRGYLRDDPAAREAVESYLFQHPKADELPEPKVGDQQEEIERKEMHSKENESFEECASKDVEKVEDLTWFAEGSRTCGCFARKHPPIGNCLGCGRIACEDEGEGPCRFCGTYVERVKYHG